MKTLILKEIREIITNTRSLFVLLICALLIPFGLYVSTKEYELKKEAFKDAKQLYEERSKNKKERDFIAEGYIPPAPLSIISNGLSDFLPDKISTNANQEWKLLVDYEMFNPIALLFGKIDLYYIITIILSLLVLMFTFNSIIGEKENGTLKLIVANAVPRWKIIIAKITGSYLAFLISFLVGIILGLVLVVLTTSVPILAQDYMTPFLTILIISLLFLFILFNMGLLLSIITRNSGSAITASLLVWVFFAIIIPKVSPMISQMIYPIDTQAVVNKKIKMKQDEIIAEYNKSCDELMARLLSDHGLNAESLNGWNMWDNPDAKAALDEYDAQIGPIGQRLSDRVVNEIGKIEKDYRNEQLFQQGICKNISRISPISCFTYLINDITNTGLKEIQNLESNARQFTLDAQSDYYSYINKNFKQYHIGHSHFSGIFGKVDDEHLKVPTLNTYYYPSITSSLTSNWIDLLLICFYALLFFALSVFQFIRYDVR